MRKEHVVGSSVILREITMIVALVTIYPAGIRNVQNILWSKEAFFVKYKLILREITGKTKMNLTNKSWIKSVNDRRLFLDCPYQVKRAVKRAHILIIKY